MTVTVQVNRVLLAGNDIATAFPFVFKTYDVADIFCSTYDSDGVETVITQGVDFSVALNADGTGTVTFPISGDPLATNSNILIRRIVPNTQETNLAVNGPYDPSSTMRGMDENTFKAIQNAEEIGRALQVPANEGALSDLPTVNVRKGKFLGFDPTTGEPVALVGTGDATDAAFVTYSPPSTGSTDRTVESRLSDTISSRDFVFTGVDHTVVFQAMLDAAAGKTLNIYNDVAYKIGQVVWPSDIKCYIEPGTIIEAIAVLGANDRLFRIFRVSNVHIVAYGAILRGLGAGTYTGEQNHGVYAVGCQNVTIEGLSCNATGGDGFYLGSSGGSGNQRWAQDTHLIDCNAGANRRQGLTINSVIGLIVEGGTFKNTVGTNPEAGIDIEPNNNLEELKDILVKAARTEDNTGVGVTVGIRNLIGAETHDGSNNASVLTDSTAEWEVNEFIGRVIINKTDGSRGKITANTATTVTATLSGGTGDDWDTSDVYAFAKEVSIVFENHVDIGGDFNYAVVQYDDTDLVVTGRISFVDCKGSVPRNGSVNIRNYGSNGPLVEFIRQTVHNNAALGGTSPKTDAAFSVSRESGDTGPARIGNIRFIEPRVIDDRPSPQTIAVLNVNDLKTTTPADEAEKVHFINPSEMGGVAAGVMIDFTGAGVVEDVYDLLHQSLTVNTTIARSNYTRTYDNAGAGAQAIFTLASDFTIGAPLMTFEVKAAQILRVEPGGSGSILPFGNGAGKYLQSSTIGHRLTLRRTSATEWTVVDIVGTWTAEA